MGVRTLDVIVTIMLPREVMFTLTVAATAIVTRTKMSNLEFSRFRCSWVYYNPPEIEIYFKDPNIYSCDTSSKNKDLQHCTGNIY